MTGPEDALYAEFAEFGKAPASPKRLGLLDLLAQGPAASTTSRPPPTSSSAAVQRTSKPCAKRDWPARAATAKDLLLALASHGVPGLWHHLHGVAQRHQLARRAYVGPEDTNASTAPSCYAA